MKKIFTILTMAVLCLCAFNGNANAQTTGTTGDCTWTLTGEDDNLTLTISGNGAMGNSSPGDAPWFSNSTNIKTVVINDGVTTIGGCAFYGCPGLTSITIPEGVTSIGFWAFAHCLSLTSISLPNSLTLLGNIPFNDCEKLEDIIVGEENANYSSLDGVLFNKDKTTIICYPIAKSGVSYIIPDGVVSIGEGAFAYCSSLTSITIPEGVTSIGEGAFAYCTGLTSITIPEGVTSIDYSTFEYCTGLTSITIPEGVTSIGNVAFMNCVGLTDVTVHWATPLAINNYDNVFLLVMVSNINLHVPAGTKALYQEASVWKDFNIIEDIPSGIQDVSGQPLQVSVSGGELSIYSESPVRRVEIYSLSGSLVVEESNFAGKINIAHLPAGVYLVKAGNKTGKFVKK